MASPSIVGERIPPLLFRGARAQRLAAVLVAVAVWAWVIGGFTVSIALIILGGAWLWVEGGVADVVQGLDLPEVADELRELGGSGLLGGQAGDRVDGVDGGLAGLAVGAPALDLNGLTGAREEQVA